ncbi:substrate-binding domain-containing protein [Phytoactinopolyspora halotolerans]|uniref:DeoR/GlpR family transcriptional regulator n=1 Tax=Phytoactinopolyspora halotolerans TaxID=1981512 RepID=A0A6L9S9X3_9ACTN|nr:substrate-binding domain-containing protein [Phytoactinopolyspora halotolerans]NEE01362.1 DeoR/GlpR family transcriptional regulator [Phytoactinopolyspora halotolerans]
MLAAHRRELILDTVRSRGTVRLRDLTDELDVSIATVRRDVTELAERGLLARVHGAIKPAHGQNGDGGAGTVAASQSSAASPGSGLTIGMLVPSTTYYYPEVIRGARAAAEDLGARLVLGMSYYNPEVEPQRVQELLAGDIDGLLVTISTQIVGDARSRLDWLAALDVPIVLVERPAGLGTGFEHLDSVYSDHVYGACLGVRHLASLGHGSVGLVTRRDSPNRALIEAGHGAGLREIGVEPGPPVTTPHPEVDVAAFDDAIRVVTEDVAGGRISALLVHNDQDAIVLMQRLHARGIRVPDDVALVAYDDESAALVDTPLTAIAPAKRDVGRTAVELLIARIAHPDERPRRHVALLPELKVRESCGATTVGTR